MIDVVCFKLPGPSYPLQEMDMGATLLISRHGKNVYTRSGVHMVTLMQYEDKQFNMPKSSLTK